MDVGVRELKQQLSAYLDQVVAGASIIVTDRGVPKALLSPLNVRAKLELGVEQGWIRPPTVATPLAPVARAQARLRAADVLGEDRGE